VLRQRGYRADTTPATLRLTPGSVGYLPAFNHPPSPLPRVEETCNPVLAAVYDIDESTIVSGHVIGLDDAPCRRLDCPGKDHTPIIGVWA